MDTPGRAARAGRQDRGHSPPVCEEAAADVPRPVTARRGTRHALRLDRLPGELRAIEVPILLSLGGQGAPRRAAMGGVLPGYVALAVTPGNGTPEEQQRHTLWSWCHIPGGPSSEVKMTWLQGKPSCSTPGKKERKISASTT